MKTLTWTKLHVSRRRSLQQAVQNAGPVEPGRHREPAGDGGRLEPADLLQFLIQIIFVKPFQLTAWFSVEANQCLANLPSHARPDMMARHERHCRQATATFASDGRL